MKRPGTAISVAAGVFVLVTLTTGTAAAASEAAAATAAVATTGAAAAPSGAAAVLGAAAVASDTVRVRPDEDLQSVLDAAPENGVVVLEAGVHRGGVTVRRPLSIQGEEGARLRGPGRGSVLVIEAEGVQVRGLEITDSGRDLSRDDAGVLVLGDGARVEDVRLRRNLHGIYVRGAEDVHLADNEIVGLADDGDGDDVDMDVADPAEDPHHQHDAAGHHHPPAGGQALMGNGIHLWNADGARVTGNRIRHARDGIYVAHTNRAEFRDNRVRDSRYGIHYMYSSDNRLTGNELSHNVAGAALMFSRHLEVTGNVLRDHSGFRAYGLLLQDVDASRFHDNEIRGNRVGVRLQVSTGNEFRGNRITYNLAGLALGAASRENRFTRNRVGPNLRNLELSGRPPPTDWAMDGVGNRWTGALTMDLTGDGISEWPHHEVDLLGERRETFPLVQLLTGSPGVRALEWALSRAPVPGTRYVTDPRPLTGSRTRD